MARNLYINGPCMVKVKGVEALVNNVEDREVKTWELGLTQGPIRIIPNFIHRDIYVDDYGDVPAEVMAMIADVQIHMTLVHYDADVLDNCMINSIGGYHADMATVGSLTAGTMAGAGKLMGNGRQLYEAGNRFITLILTSRPTSLDPPGTDPNEFPWRFPAAYIAANPMEIPIGTERSLVTLRWRAIPYRPPFAADANNPAVSTTTVQELKSKGAVLWYRSEE